MGQRYQTTGYQALTEKEKETLRLLLDGHDAKSMARHLSLSVHTINERLRDARRKLAVTSSKEAARVLRQMENMSPELIGNKFFGDASSAAPDHSLKQSHAKPRSNRRAGWAIGGSAMIVSFVILAMSMSTPVPIAQPDAGLTKAIVQSNSPAVQTQASTPASLQTEATTAALNWLALVDDDKWAESWAATSQSFKSLNTVALWQSTSEQVRAQMGHVKSRKFLSEQDVPAPPKGYTMIRFKTDYANKNGAIETVTLEREDGNWKVVGIYIE